MSTNIYKGLLGEEMAVAHLLKNGYTILEKNWRSQHLEIDIIASIEKTLVIIEVKLRVNDLFGRPEEFVSKQKQRNIIKASSAYITQNDIDFETRFDIISIIKNEKETKLDHIIQAFQPTVSKF